MDPDAGLSPPPLTMPKTMQISTRIWRVLPPTSSLPSGLPASSALVVKIGRQNDGALKVLQLEHQKRARCGPCSADR